MRTAKLKRETRETKINLSLDLDGTGKSNIDTGIGFFDHMLEQLCYHSMINLNLEATGDIKIDFHHRLPRGGQAHEGHPVGGQFHQNYFHHRLSREARSH